MGPLDHGLKPPNPWAEMNLPCFFKSWFISGICYSNGKLTQAVWEKQNRSKGFDHK
jgi:hypothetical protein